MFSRSDLNLWSILKHCIGKDLSKVAMPVVFNEPLSFLQRITEYMEYSFLLHRADECDDPVDRIQYVAAFAVSALASNWERLGKPFNPLLGETYELVRKDIGFRIICEQVSHHPPASAFHADSPHFIFHGFIHPKLRFLGKTVEIKPEGTLTVKLLRHKEVYAWTNVSCRVHNIIAGKLWFEQYGTLELVGHDSGLNAVLHFKPAGRLSKDVHQLEGFVCNKHHLDKFPDNLGAVSDEQEERFHQDLKVMEERYQGRWDKSMMADYCWSSIKRDCPDEVKTKLRFLYGKWSEFLKSADVEAYEEYVRTFPKKLRLPDYAESASAQNTSFFSTSPTGSPGHTPKRMVDKFNSFTRSFTGGGGGGVSCDSLDLPTEDDTFDTVPKIDSPWSEDIPNSVTLWQADPRPEYSAEYYHFTLFAIALNELDNDMKQLLPPTDSRLRPDIQKLELGDIDGAAYEKNRLEEKQRDARKQRKKHKIMWEPRWFKLEHNPYTKADDWIYTGGYWEREFSRCPDIF